MSYVYVKFEHGEFPLWTTGFYDPQGKWHPDEDYSSARDAAERVHYLNGGVASQSQINSIETRLDNVDSMLESLNERIDQPEWRKRR